MIITRTPLRISFAGGGSDLPAYCEHEQGTVLSATIDKYIYVTVNKHFSDKVRLSYSRTENVDLARYLEHDIARETLAWMDIDTGLEITSIADVPSGTGLGSSSAYTVGLLNALCSYYRGGILPPNVLADDASCIEIERCNHPIGRQDHYAAAYGGLRHYTFDGVRGHAGMRYNTQADLLHPNLLLLYMGVTRNANAILQAQHYALSHSSVARGITRDMVGLVNVLCSALLHSDMDSFAMAMHDAWMLKRSILNTISTHDIDALYRLALTSGAKSGKLCGAGGGGFLLLFVEPEHRQRVINSLGLVELPFKFTQQGSQVVYSDQKAVAEYA